MENKKTLHFLSAHRFVFFAGPEGAGKEVQGQGETPEQSEYEDPAKRFDVYKQAEQKAAELESSGDPKKAEWAKKLRDRAKEARERESQYDASMAITDAHGLQRTLLMLARVEQRSAQKNYEEPKTRFDVYTRAQQMAKEYKASGDPKKVEWAQKLEERIAKAKADESKMDTSMAMMEATGLERTMAMLARNDLREMEEGPGRVVIGKIEVTHVPKKPDDTKPKSPEA